MAHPSRTTSAGRRASPANRQATTSAKRPPVDEGAQSRAPQHERGRRRVDAILDAASAIIVEEGPAGISVESIAKRSATSKSSMYHFFPSCETVVRALAERHIAAIQAEASRSLAEDFDWSSLTVAEAVDRFLGLFEGYAARHPDVLPVMQAATRLERDPVRPECTLDGLQLQRAEQLVAARSPQLSLAERRVRAATLFGVSLGTMMVAKRMPKAQRPGMSKEVRKVLVAYLSRVERDDARR
jgi:AcrR family transcriptional regulator